MYIHIYEIKLKLYAPLSPVKGFTLPTLLCTSIKALHVAIRIAMQAIT